VEHHHLDTLFNPYVGNDNADDAAADDNDNDDGDDDGGDEGLRNLHSDNRT
jgi:hypothetical protein